MIYSYDIDCLINNIPTRNIIAYLDDLGWQIKKTKRDDDIRMYSTPSDLENFHVIVPINKELTDYKSAMKHLVNGIAEAYKKDVKRIVMELLNPNADIIKIRVISEESDSGVIGIDRGLDLFNNTKSMLMYSAKEITKYKQIYRGRSNSDVSSIIDACKIGQTEIGSFLISIICPFYEFVEGKPQQLTLFDKDIFADSKTRRTTTQLITSLSKIKKAVIEQQVSFLSSPESGISVNFFESLSKIGISNDGCQIEVKAEWSPITPNRNINIDTVCLSKENEYDAIKSTITRVRKSEPESKRFNGKIRDLKTNTEKRDEGGVIVLVHLGQEDKTTSTKFTLSVDLYDLAIEAHRQNADVKVIASSDGNTWSCEELEIIS